MNIQYVKTEVPSVSLVCMQKTVETNFEEQKATSKIAQSSATAGHILVQRRVVGKPDSLTLGWEAEDSRTGHAVAVRKYDR